MLKEIKNPEVFKKPPFEEFKKGDRVKLKNEDGNLYEIIDVNPNESLAILADLSNGRREKQVDFSRLELVGSRKTDKLFDDLVEQAKKASQNSRN